jgi:hypothetical protein
LRLQKALAGALRREPTPIAAAIIARKLTVLARIGAS